MNAALERQDHMERKKRRKAAGFLAVGLLLMMLTGCQRKIEPVSKSGFMLNTFVTITIYDKDDPAILEGCFNLCKSYENIFSKTLEASEIYRLNHRPDNEQTFAVSEAVAELLSKGLYYSGLSEGAFDITVEPLTSLWDFTSPDHVVPSDVEIREAVRSVGYENIELTGTTLTFLSRETAIDLGAIAKGYIGDRMKEYLLEQGVNSAVINLGGNVLCVGKRPDGAPFKIGLQKPYADRNETIENLDITDMSVVSSGVYERHFVKDGINYHHILNPKDGYPYQNGLISVTIISDLSVDGDALSTTCFSLGLQEGRKLLDSIEGVYGIFITEDYEVVYSEGAGRFLENTP